MGERLRDGENYCDGWAYRQICELLGDPLGNKSMTGRSILTIMCNFICRIFTAGIHRGAEILVGMPEI